MMYVLCSIPLNKYYMTIRVRHILSERSRRILIQGDITVLAFCLQQHKRNVSEEYVMLMGTELNYALNIPTFNIVFKPVT
jgi:hypothetical protein